MPHEYVRLEPKRRQWDAYVNRHANGMSKRTQRNHVTLCVTLRAVYGNVFKLSARHTLTTSTLGFRTLKMKGTIIQCQSNC